MRSLRSAGLLLALATILALNLIQWIGAGFNPTSPPWFGLLTITMDLCLIASSAILGPILLARGRRFFGCFFCSNLAVMAGAFALRVSKVEFSRAVLFGADLYWLNLYLLALALEWRTILGDRPREKPIGSIPRE